MEIRPLSVDDYAAVCRLWMKTPGMGLNTLDDSREGMEKYLTRNPHTCFAAVTEGRVVGVILCGHDGRRGYIYHTCVAADHRNRGIGSALVTAGLEALEREGIHKAALVVFSHNKAGNDFWQKRGFSLRDDLQYRNKTIKESIRVDT